MGTQKILRYLSAILLIGFGLVTLLLSTSIIFDLFSIRAKEGKYVLIIVWANFMCSLLYLLAAYGFLKKKGWTKFILGIATLILIIAFTALKVHISSGGLYETKTVGAMLFRTGFTLILTLSAYFTIKKDTSDEFKG